MGRKDENVGGDGEEEVLADGLGPSTRSKRRFCMAKGKGVFS